MSTNLPVTFEPIERQLTIDALLTYGMSLAALIRSERFQSQPDQRAKLFVVLLRTTALVKRLGGQVPAEMQLHEFAAVDPPSTTDSHPVH